MNINNLINIKTIEKRIREIIIEYINNNEIKLYRNKFNIRGYSNFNKRNKF